jgi:seryl-tRNA synthetase
MLDINNFIASRGGDPEKIRESQRRRGASVEVVDQVIESFEDSRKGTFSSRNIQDGSD